MLELFLHHLDEITDWLPMSLMALSLEVPNSHFSNQLFVQKVEVLLFVTPDLLKQLFGIRYLLIIRSVNELPRRGLPFLIFFELTLDFLELLRNVDMNLSLALVYQTLEKLTVSFNDFAVLIKLSDFVELLMPLIDLGELGPDLLYYFNVAV